MTACRFSAVLLSVVITCLQYFNFPVSRPADGIGGVYRDRHRHRRTRSSAAPWFGGVRATGTVSEHPREESEREV
ncbi:hypothetical protein [Actinomadura spongiicola]|uniref:hypothetical protein n=1 Tax=Actinomadura spongiicola TaxID=2303421 RepID=UPI0018F2133D|nr:hypothetical protein [Actinomadura spongiicola]